MELDPTDTTLHHALATHLHPSVNDIVLPTAARTLLPAAGGRVSTFTDAFAAPAPVNVAGRALSSQRAPCMASKSGPAAQYHDITR